MNRSALVIPGDELFQSRLAWKFTGALGLLCLSFAWPGSAVAQKTPAKYAKMAPIGQYLSTSKAAEIALARSAAPKSVVEHATILTLGKNGYETAVKGNNGFVCFVERSWAQDFDVKLFWDPHMSAPQCWNAAAVRSLLPEYLERTQWVLQGLSKDEMLTRTKAELAAHKIGFPAPGSMAYMLSKQQYLSPPTPRMAANWYPHVMFWAPAGKGMGDSAWGANVPGSPIYATTSDVEPITTYFVVVAKWSDGTFGPYFPKPGNPAQKHHH